MGIVRDLYYARKMSAGLKLPAPTVALLIKRLRLAAAMGGDVTKTVSGTMVHITDALAKAALSVLASIEPIQDLHGYSNPWPAGGGVNKLDPIAVFGGAPSIYDVNADGTVTVKSSDSRSWGNVPELQLPAGTYNISKENATGLSAVRLSTEGYSTDHYFNPVGGYTFTFSEPASIKVKMSYASATYPKTEKPQIVIGQTAPTAWTPYSNICPISGLTGLSVYVSPTQDPDDATVYNVDWTTQAGTVYGGTLDVVSGELTVDMVNIPSYNGETINEPWLSSMDAYAEGTTPTIGAQVVYTLATPVTYQLTPQEVQMLLGENYVWSSSGDTVSVTYYAEGNANTLQSLNILLGGNYSNPKTADDVSDKEALEIILGGNK